MAPDDQLSRIAGLNQTLQGVMGIVAPPVGAILLDTMPMYGIILIDVGTALIAIIPLFFFTIPQPVAAIHAPGTSGVKCRLQGYAGRLSICGQLAGDVDHISCGGGSELLIEPCFFIDASPGDQGFNGTAYHLGLLEAVFGIGVVIGGLTAQYLGGI